MDSDRAAVRPPRLRGRSGRYSHRREYRPRVRVHMLGHGLSLAGFQAVISGRRFWVFTEAIINAGCRRLTGGNPN
jgi:hypothetical protein